MPKVFSAVKAIIHDKGKFLIIKFVHPKITIWDLPGGCINYGESPFNTLIREVKEETNLEIKIIKSVGIWWFYPAHKKDTQIICHTFLCQAINKDIDLTKNPDSEIHTDYDWVTKKEFLHDPKYNNIENSLKELINKTRIK